MNTVKPIIISMSIIFIIACTHNQETIYSTSPYSTNRYNEMQYYTQTYDLGNTNERYETERQQVAVPDSYHVGSSYAPARAKDRDKNWVRNQNPQSYTITIAEDEKPASVAKKLYQLPKSERSAEINFQRNGKSVYQGVYGSYRSKEDAEKALNSLPAEVKQNADIKEWSSVQSNIN